jgi:hypothetical protein
VQSKSCRQQMLLQLQLQQLKLSQVLQLTTVTAADGAVTPASHLLCSKTVQALSSAPRSLTVACCHLLSSAVPTCVLLAPATTSCCC